MRARNLRLKTEQEVIDAARILVSIHRQNPTATFTPGALAILVDAVERLEMFDPRPAC